MKIRAFISRHLFFISLCLCILIIPSVIAYFYDYYLSYDRRSLNDKIFDNEIMLLLQEVEERLRPFQKTGFTYRDLPLPMAMEALRCEPILTNKQVFMTVLDVIDQRLTWRVRANDYHVTNIYHQHLLLIWCLIRRISVLISMEPDRWYLLKVLYVCLRAWAYVKVSTAYGEPKQAAYKYIQEHLEHFSTNEWP